LSSKLGWDSGMKPASVPSVPCLVLDHHHPRAVHSCFWSLRLVWCRKRKINLTCTFKVHLCKIHKCPSELSLLPKVSRPFPLFLPPPIRIEARVRPIIQPFLFRISNGQQPLPHGTAHNFLPLPLIFCECGSSGDASTHQRLPSFPIRPHSASHALRVRLLSLYADALG